MFMKKYLGIFVLALLVSVFSCKKEVEPACVDCGEKAGEITKRSGFAFYDSTAARYYVDFFFPGSTDTHTVNYVCDLPEKFRKTPLQVVVSGTLFESSLRPTAALNPAGKAYCLKLDSIEEK